MDTSLLKSLQACDEAIDWVSTQPDSQQQAWERCERADWLLWLAEKLGADEKALRLSACACAETALPFADEKTREVCARTIEVARRFARGEALESELFAARYAAECAAGFAAWYAAESAARSAAESAAWYAARYAAECAASYAARSAAHRKMCDLIREIIPWNYVERLIARREK